MTHPVMYTKLSLKKKKVIWHHYRSSVSNLQLSVISCTKYSKHSAIKYSGMLILGRKTCNLTWMAFLTQNFYSSSQSAPRWPRIQFLARQKFFVAPCPFLTSCADQLFCQNKKSKSFKMSLDEWNKTNPFLKKKKREGGAGEGKFNCS